MNVQNAIKKMGPVMEQVLGRISGTLSGRFDTGSILEGKRYRAYLFFALAQKEDERSLKIASALEIIHAATLVHDDVIDGGLLRRSMPAVHRIKGVTAAILYGDLLFNAAFGLLAETGESDLWRACHSAVSLVVGGELDQQLKKRDIHMGEDEYLDIIERKTGALFALSCRLAGMVSCRSAEEIGSLEVFGRALGTAYQILDDCMDLLDSGRDKTSYRDIQNGVMTLPIIAGFDRRREVLSEVFAELPVPGDRMADVARQVVMSGGLGKAVDRASGLMREGVTALPRSCMEKERPVRSIVEKIMKKVEHVKKENSDLRRRFCRDQRVKEAGRA